MQRITVNGFTYQLTPAELALEQSAFEAGEGASEYPQSHDVLKIVMDLI